MLCIFCSTEKPPSSEHVIPLAISGTVKTDRVCQACNSILGSRVDAALSDFFPIRARRAQLGLAGNSGAVPEIVEMLLGEGKLVGESGSRIHTTFNKKTQRLEHRLLHQVSETVSHDGKKIRQISVDASDVGQIPKIIQRERKRNGLQPLPEDLLTEAAQQITSQSIVNPVVQLSLNINFAYLRHAMIKIAYELAFLWLGESYLDDPMAKTLRTAVLSPDIESTENIKGFIGFSNEEQFTVFNFWTPHEAHHLAFGSILNGNVLIAVRIFDIYAAGIVVSQQAHQYFQTDSDAAKLRFIAIDAVSGRTINTGFDEESRRLALEMTKHRRPPPFPDPLSSNFSPE